MIRYVLKALNGSVDTSQLVKDVSNVDGVRNVVLDFTFGREHLLFVDGVFDSLKVGAEITHGGYSIARQDRQ